jgi:hypothetical protein
MPEGNQDHGRVPLAPPIALGGLDELLNLTLDQVLPRSKLSIRPPNGYDCPIYSCWRYQLETRFFVIGPSVMVNCPRNTDSLRVNSEQL